MRLCGGPKKTEKLQKKKESLLGIGLENIPFCFSRRIYKIVEKLTSIQLSDCWNELEAVLKNYPNRDKPQSSIFYFNYYNVIKILKKKSKTLKDVHNNYILNNSWKKLPDFRANTLSKDFRAEDIWS